MARAGDWLATRIDRFAQTRFVMKIIHQLLDLSGRRYVNRIDGIDTNTNGRDILVRFLRPRRRRSLRRRNRPRARRFVSFRRGCSGL